MHRAKNNLPAIADHRRVARTRRGHSRQLQFERLEDRSLFSSVPFGAMPEDTGEYLLGDVLVTLVLMESKPNPLFASNTETWTSAAINDVKAKVTQAMQWWDDTLDARFPGHAHQLDFHFDFTYADRPVATDYEPISHTSNWFRFWIYDFFDQVGYNATGDYSQDIRAFNHAQRLSHGTDWAFTIFVANDANDGDKAFAPGGQFRLAFSFPGGEFIVAPASRPVDTFAHETGHMFWARDEYRGGGSYTDRRGYYNTQNTNAADNPAPGFVQQVSLMADGSLVSQAFAAHTSSTSSLEMIGWRDADGDGVFDLMDVPQRLTGTGYRDGASGAYRFLGRATVQTLPNQNSSGLQNDITLSRISAIEYRIDEGFWQTALLLDDTTVDLDVSVPLPPAGDHVVELRTIDGATGVTSNVFRGTTAEPSSVVEPGLNGFVWNDADGDGRFDPSERGLAGWLVQAVDASGVVLELQRTLEPDAHPASAVLNTVLTDVTLDTFLGSDQNVIADGIVQAVASGATLPGNSFGWKGQRRVPQSGSTFLIEDIPLTPGWIPGGPQLRIQFEQPVSAVRLDAIGTLATTGSDRLDYARLEVFDRQGNLLERVTSGPLSADQVETMSATRATADIAFALVKGHYGDAVRLDRLRVGPESSAVTDPLGAYALPGLPAGSYRLRATGPGGAGGSPGERAVALAEGESLDQVNFAGEVISWQNAELAEDVNGDQLVTPLDALVLINWINTHPNDSALPPAPAEPPPYFDVDGSGFVTALDVLRVVNLINSQPQQAAGAEAEPFRSFPSSSPEGESGADTSGRERSLEQPLRGAEGGTRAEGAGGSFAAVYPAVKPAPAASLSGGLVRASINRLWGRSLQAATGWRVSTRLEEAIVAPGDELAGDFAERADGFFALYASVSSTSTPSSSAILSRFSRS